MNSTADNGVFSRFQNPAPGSLLHYMCRDGSDPKLHLLNLVWSIWVFLSPLFGRVDAAFWWSLALSYPVFLLLFVLMHLRPIGEVKYYVGALTMLACLAMPTNPSAWTYAVFACAYATVGSASPRAGIFKILMIETLLVLEAWWMGLPWFVMALMVGVCSSSGFGAMFGRLTQAKNAQLQLSQDEVRRLAATAERERIGRDLHDLLGHTLSLITLKLELSRKLFDRDHAAARRELEEAESVARHALAEVRSAVTGIRATDLAAELASAHLLLESSGVSLVYDQPQQELPPTIEPALAMMVREAVTNITRHARATRAHVEVRLSDDAVKLHISDDGRGGIREMGNGLDGMRERVRGLGGDMRIDSPRGRGTVLDISVPLPKRSHDTPASSPSATAGLSDDALSAGSLAGGGA